MNVTQRILETLRKDSGRVCPTCNDFLTTPGNTRWEYCEACRRATHMHCVEMIDGSPFCSDCSLERRKEITLDASMEIVKAFVDGLRPHLETLVKIDAGGDHTAVLTSLLRAAADLCDRWEFPLCEHCGSYAAPVSFSYRGDSFTGCVECRGRVSIETEEMAASVSIFDLPVADNSTPF